MLAPLGTVYRDDNMVYGMVVLDITDLDAVRYGIVGFYVCEMIHVTSPGFGFRMTRYGPEPRGYAKVTVEEHWPREPLSAPEYMSKFG